MIPIRLFIMEHVRQERLFAAFEFNKTVNDIVKGVYGAKWSNTHKQWHFPLTKESAQQIIQLTKEVAIVDVSELRQQLIKRKQLKAESHHAVADVTEKPLQSFAPEAAKPYSSQNSNAALLTIPVANREAMEKFLQTLQLKAYSTSTVKTYKSEFAAFLQILGNVKAESLSVQRVKDYLSYCHAHLRLTENTIHSRINALKFYYEQVLKREKFFWEIPRPKKPLILPKVMSEAELSRLFNGVRYLKHKAILFTAYSAGLRVSEVINLEWKHIDRQRGQVLINQAKGKKDRYVSLSPILEDILISYYKRCKIKPVKYVFESAVPGRQYSARSAQAIFQQAKTKAGIKKEIGFHSLRHSFATHLLEKGTDVKYIQELLGHFSIKTTIRYLHVAKEKLVAIESPLDDLWRHGGIEWDG